MKLFTFAMAVVLALALGGMVGFGAGSQHSAPQVGDTVTVVAKPDPLGDGWLAVAIVTR